MKQRRAKRKEKREYRLAVDLLEITSFTGIVSLGKFDNAERSYAK